MFGLPKLRKTRKTLLLVVLAAAACGVQQSHGYAQSTDGSLSFRYPVDWQEVDVEPQGLEWVVGVDGSADPSAANQIDFVQDEPFVLAQVVPLDPEVRDQATLSLLRSLALQDRRDPTIGNDPSITLLFHDEIVDDRGFEGHHLQFEVELDSGTARAEHLAVFDPDRSHIQRIRVACSVACFEANNAAIEELFDSVRFRQ